MAETIEKSLLDLDFAALTRRTFTPSPAAWEDQVLYFLLLDRFSDGNEKGGYRDNDGRPVTRRRHAAVPARGPRPRRLRHVAPRRRRLAGRHAQGAAGASSATSGGSASPRCGSARRSGRSPSSRATTATASRTSSTWTPTSARARSSATSSRPPTSRASTSSSTSSPTTPATSSPTTRTATRRTTRPRGGGTTTRAGTAGPTPSQASTTATAGRRCRSSRPSRAALEAAWPDGAIWPREFQRPELYLRKGHITNWDYYPEYVEGDMFGLKTLDLRVQWDGQYPRIASALPALALVYGFWIAYADLDGFRIDAAKHMGGRVAADLLRRHPGVRPEHRQGELPPGRGDRRQPRARLGGRGEDRAGRGPGDRGRPGQAGADGHRLRRPGGLLLPVPQLGAGGAGRAPLVPQPGGDPGGRPRPGPQGRRQVALLRRRRGSATWRSTCWPCS